MNGPPDYIAQDGRMVPLCEWCQWWAAVDGPFCEGCRAKRLATIAAPPRTGVEQRAGITDPPIG